MKLLAFFLTTLIITALTGCSTDSDKEKAPGFDQDNPSYVFIGNYTRDEGWVHGKAEGIYRFKLNEDLTLTEPELVFDDIINPSFLAISPDGNNLYAVSEMAREDEPTGFVYAFEVEEDKSLTFIERYPTNGKAPAHISVHPSGKLVFASNYVGGVTRVYQRKADDSLEPFQEMEYSGSGPHPNQNGSHPHMMKVSPDGNYLFTPDLGADKIYGYEIHAETENKALNPTAQKFVEVAPGSGPRHMDFHPSLNIAYVMNELNSTVSVFDYDPETGSLTEKQVITTLPDDFDEWNSTADIHVHPNGKFLYASNRGHNTIASYSINTDTGELTFLEHTPTEGAIPRNFNIHPDGTKLYVANQDTDNITIFDLNTVAGELSYTGNAIQTPTPVNITFY